MLSSLVSVPVRFFMLKFWVLLMYCVISSTRCDAIRETRTAIIIATGARIMISHLNKKIETYFESVMEGAKRMKLHRVMSKRKKE